MVSAMLGLALAAALPGAYDCGIDQQIVVTETGVSDVAVNFGDLGQEPWRFSVRVPGGGRQVTVDWPGDPIQIAGTHAAVPIAPGQLTFLALARGPCMFTEQACASLVSLSARADGTAAISILPAGSIRDQATDVRSLFHVVFLGTCRRRDQAERP